MHEWNIKGLFLLVWKVVSWFFDMLTSIFSGTTVKGGEENGSSLHLWNSAVLRWCILYLAGQFLIWSLASFQHFLLAEPALVYEMLIVFPCPLFLFFHKLLLLRSYYECFTFVNYFILKRSVTLFQGGETSSFKIGISKIPADIYSFQ